MAAIKALSAAKELQVQAYKEEGKTHDWIARKMKVHRNTVANILKRLQEKAPASDKVAGHDAQTPKGSVPE